MEKNLLQRI